MSENPAESLPESLPAIQPLGGDHRDGERLLFLLLDRGRRRPRNVARLLSENRPSTHSIEEWIEKCRIFQFGQPHISADSQTDTDRQIYMRSLRHDESRRRGSPFAAAFWKPKNPDTLRRGRGCDIEALRRGPRVKS